MDVLYRSEEKHALLGAVVLHKRLEGSDLGHIVLHRDICQRSALISSLSAANSSGTCRM